MREHVFELDDVDTEFCVNCSCKKNFDHWADECLHTLEHKHIFVRGDWDWECKKCEIKSKSFAKPENDIMKLHYIYYDKVLLRVTGTDASLENHIIIGCTMSDEQYEDQQTVKQIIE